MIALEIVIQILTIVVLLMLAGVLWYLFTMMQKVNKRLDSLLEILDYYEKIKAVALEFMNGPGKMYIEIFQSVLSFVVPFFTKKK